MDRLIYADNAATTQLDNIALDAMIPILEEEYGNPSQPYSFSRNVKLALSAARSMIASCINALPEEIYFTSGGTESDNLALKGFLWGKPFSNAVLTSEFEHHAILNTCSSLKELGYEISYVKPSSEGRIEVNNFVKAITSDTIIASIMMANNEIGTIQNIRQLAEAAHMHGLVFHTDAVQALGHIKIDVQELGVDMLSGSAHKFNGPKGVGFIYVRKGVKLHSLLDGGAQERSLRAGTENVASIYGMAVALEHNCKQLNNNSDHCKNLESALLDRLDAEKIEYVKNGGKNCLPGLLSLSFPNNDGEALLHRLDLLGISVSTGAACDSVNTQISHVLKAIDLDEQLAKGTIRISLGKYNTMQDVEAIVNALKRIVK